MKNKKFYLHEKRSYDGFSSERMKHKQSSVSSLRVERSFVQKRPAEENTRSASTDVGGTVSRHC